MIDLLMTFFLIFLILLRFLLYQTPKKRLKFSPAIFIRTRADSPNYSEDEYALQRDNKTSYDGSFIAALKDERKEL